MMRKKLSMLLACALAAAPMLMSGMGVTAEETGKYGSGEWRTYDEPIDISIGVCFDINDEGFTAMANIGEPYDDNRWIRMYQEDVGINVKYDLVAPNSNDYQQQLILAMTSGNLPDIFYVNDLSLYKQMAEAGTIADLTDIYAEEANPVLRGVLEAEGDNFMGNYMIDGRLYCIPGKMPSTNGYSYLWIRKDWLDKLGLEVPKTMDDVMEVARAFVEQDPDGNGVDDTMGLSIDENYTKFGQEGIFWAFGGKSAGQKMWVELEDGTLGYSMVQPEMKGGLRWLQEMYTQGLLNPEFSTQPFTDIPEMVATNKLGMFYGCHWYSGQLNVVKDEIPEAEWIPILAPGTDGNPAPVWASVDTHGFYCVNSACENPEALIAMCNAYTEKLFGENNDFSNYFACPEDGGLWQAGPIWMLAADVDIIPHREMKEAMKNGTLDSLEGVGGDYWKQIQSGDISYELMFGPEGSCFELVDATYPDIFHWNKYQGAPTQTQGERWSSMQEIIDTEYIKIIKGELDVDEGFDAMVEAWMNAGGDKVTEEINAIVNGN